MTDTVPGEPVDTKICPSCAEPVRTAARMCRYCGYHFDEVTAPAVVSPGRSVRGGGITATIAGALLILGSFLPWVSVHLVARTIRASGMHWRAGTVTLLLGAFLLVVGICALAKLRLPAPTGPVTMAAGVLAAVIGIWELARIRGHLDALRFFSGRFGHRLLFGRLATGHVGIGVWAVIAGGALAAVSGIFLLRATGQPPSLPSRSGDDQPAGVSA